MNAHDSLEVYETVGYEIAGNTQKMILSQALRGSLAFPTDHVYSFANGHISESSSKAECLKL